MADTKISDLTELAQGTIANTDLIAVVDTSATSTKKYTWLSALTDIATYIASAVMTLSNKTLSSPTVTGTETVDNLQTSGSAGVAIKNSGGTTVLTIGPANGTGVSTAGQVNFGGAAVPSSDDGAALGSTGNKWSDLFLAEGGVINWDNGDATITQSGNTITVAGAELIIEDGSAYPTSTVSSGFRGVPQNSQSAAYTLVLSDAGKHILHPTADNNARTFTIPANSSVAYPIGTTITFINQINTVTISITTDTLTLAGTGTTGSRTLAANGIATAVKVGTTSWVINGTGLT